MIQFPSKGAELLVEQLDHVKVIEHMHRLWQVVPHGSDVGRRHIGGHGGDLGARSPQTLPEVVQGVRAFAVADKDHGAAKQIQDHGHVTMSLADGDFIDGDLRACAASACRNAAADCGPGCP